MGNVGAFASAMNAPSAWPGTVNFTDCAPLMECVASTKIAPAPLLCKVHGAAGAPFNVASSKSSQKMALVQPVPLPAPPVPDAPDAPPVPLAPPDAPEAPPLAAPDVPAAAPPAPPAGVPPVAAPLAPPLGVVPPVGEPAPDVPPCAEAPDPPLPPPFPPSSDADLLSHAAATVARTKHDANTGLGDDRSLSTSIET